MGKELATDQKHQVKRHRLQGKGPENERPIGPSSGVTAVLQLQRLVGNRAVQRLLASRTSVGLAQRQGGGAGFDLDDETTGRSNRAVTRLVQAKLTVGPVGDRYEQEADRVADQVMSMPAPAGQRPVQRQEEEEELAQMKPLAASITPLVQRQTEEEEQVQMSPLIQRQEEEEEIQVKPLLQRQEEEEVQMKPLAALITPLVQRQAEEEEEVQMKPLAQRQAEEEEELAQMKPLTQRQEEEEEVQMKPLVQRQEEEEEVQMMPVVQRQVEEEEEQVQMKPFLQRQVEPEEEEEPIQAKSTEVIQRRADGGFEAGSELESRLAAHRGGGSPLSDEVRSFMEPRFGADFGGVRVHTGSEAAQMSRELSAQSFTHGQDIYFGAGRYAPGSTAGKRLLAHELTHSIQQTGRIRQKQQKDIEIDTGDSATTRSLVQRAVWNPDDIVNALNNIGFIKEKLGKTIRKETMKQHVEKALNMYRQHRSEEEWDDVHNAMMMTMALDGVARMIAEELYDPSIQPQLASKLLELYRGEIKTELGKKGVDETEQKEAFELAETLISGDPVSQYMHREIRKETAAQQIRTMATKSAMQPLDMFKLLSQRFQAEMASYKLEQLHPDVYKTYSIYETPGELSQHYFKFLFGEGVQPAWEATDEGDKLKFTEGAQEKLDELEDLVRNPPLGTDEVELRPGVETEKQERHLRILEEEERGTGLDQVRRDLMNVFMTLFDLDQPKAQQLLTDVENWIPTVPLTITVKGEDWFGQKPLSRGTKFAPATRELKEKKVSEIFGKGGEDIIKYSGKYEHPKHGKERGEHYLRFRNWKDNLMTSLLDFTAEEMPTFGAFNVSWEVSRGTKEPGHGRTKFEYGHNYYGDTHFLLKRNNVENRLIYTATDHGKPRRNPLLALHDFAMGGSHTEIKDVKKHDMVAQIVNAAKVRRLEMPSLIFEIQIFGQVDITKDVEKIYLAPDISKLVKTNVKKFQKQKGVPYEVIEKPKGLKVTHSLVQKLAFDVSRRVKESMQWQERKQTIETGLGGEEREQIGKLMEESQAVETDWFAWKESVSKFLHEGYNLLKMTPTSIEAKNRMRNALEKLKTLVNDIRGKIKNYQGELDKRKSLVKVFSKKKSRAGKFGGKLDKLYTKIEKYCKAYV